MHIWKDYIKGILHKYKSIIFFFFHLISWVSALYMCGRKNVSWLKMQITLHRASPITGISLCFVPSPKTTTTPASPAEQSTHLVRPLRLHINSSAFWFERKCTWVHIVAPQITRTASPTSSLGHWLLPICIFYYGCHLTLLLFLYVGWFLINFSILIEIDGFLFIYYFSVSELKAVY